MTFERKELAKRFQRLPCTTFSDMTLLTWPDIDRHRELKMSTTKPQVEITQKSFFLVFVAEILGSGCRPVSDKVGAGMSESDIVEYMGVAIDI